MKPLISLFSSALLALVLLQPGLSWGAEPLSEVAPPVNINQASAEELAESLSGVGKSRAQAIVESREAHGPFGSAEALMRVKGVGEATIERNRARIRLE